MGWLVSDNQGQEDKDQQDQDQDKEDPLAGAGRPVFPTGPIQGCAVNFWADNKRHHALCLAVLGDELLLEHKGPSRCRLFIGKVTETIPHLRAGVASATITVGGLKTCRYRSLPKKWLQEMVSTGQTWKGVERGGGLAPSPTDLLI